MYVTITQKNRHSIARFYKGNTLKITGNKAIFSQICNWMEVIHYKK